VIGRADIVIPNSVRVHANDSKLYVKDSSPGDSFPTLQEGAAGMGSLATSVYDLDDDVFPVNKRMIGIS
jgi:hypothetical protein